MERKKMARRQRKERKRKEQGKEGLRDGKGGRKERGGGADASLVSQLQPITFHPYCVKSHFSLVSICVNRSIVFFL